MLKKQMTWHRVVAVGKVIIFHFAGGLRRLSISAFRLALPLFG